MRQCLYLVALIRLAQLPYPCLAAAAHLIQVRLQRLVSPCSFVRSRSRSLCWALNQRPPAAITAGTIRSFNQSQAVTPNHRWPMANSRPSTIGPILIYFQTCREVRRQSDTKRLMSVLSSPAGCPLRLHLAFPSLREGGPSGTSDALMRGREVSVSLHIYPAPQHVASSLAA